MYCVDDPCGIPAPSASCGKPKSRRRAATPTHVTTARAVASMGWTLSAQSEYPADA